MEIIDNRDRSLTKYYSNSIKTWALLTKFVFELLNRGNFVPILEPRKENIYKGRWRLILKTQSDSERFKAILRNSSWTAFNLPINFISGKKKSWKSDGLWHPSYLFSKYMDNIGDFVIRSTLKKFKFKTFEDFYSSEIEKEKNTEYEISWDYKFLKSLIKPENNFKINKFHETIIPSIVNNWVQITQGSIFNQGISITLELKHPKDLNKEWLLLFYLTLQNDKSYPLKVFLEGKYDQKKEILKFFDSEEQLLESILRALGIAAKIFPPIKRALESKIPNELTLNSSEVMNFLKYPKDLLIQSGFNVILPDVFTRGGKHRLSARLIIRSKDKKKTGVKTKLPAMFDINSVLEYKWEITLEGTELTENEFKELIESREPLINWRGNWVLIDPKEVEELRVIIDKSTSSGTKNYMEAIKLGLSGKIQLEDNGNEYDVIIEGDFQEIVGKLLSIESFEEISTPKSFNGTLRPYQQTALTWMSNMCELYFGLCLADDMGLGKTIQIISYLLYRKEINPEEPGSTLIICPTSVLFNWKRELERFAPNLEVIFHHGRDRIKDISGISEYMKPHLIILTSYGTIRNDVDFLETIPFKGIIVDEIQNIKNYSAKQTQAIFKLQGQFKIGLSGTPIENRLLELWTLFEFLNLGLLGSRTEFQKNFIIPIERFQDPEAIEKLKRIISPFILRRMKSDKSIISDLPEKNEIKLFVELSNIQANLYKELVDKALKEIESNLSDKMNILNLLIKFKQLCNHPYQYLHKKAPLFRNDENLKDFLHQSRKLERLLEMTDEIISNGEKVLIFTQFTQMGDIIHNILEAKYKFRILYFHGGVPEKKRREIVDEFQSDDIESPPIMILSLKAGGTGLNLTQATTVFHYDSPWNPAIQDQATDRAYRIGQNQLVNVYIFITIGTIEEKIDALLEEKRNLAKKIIETQGESTILSLDKDKLLSLFSLDI